MRRWIHDHLLQAVRTEANRSMKNAACLIRGLTSQDTTATTMISSCSLTQTARRKANLCKPDRDSVTTGLCFHKTGSEDANFLPDRFPALTPCIMWFGFTIKSIWIQVPQRKYSYSWNHAYNITIHQPNSKFTPDLLLNVYLSYWAKNTILSETKVCISPRDNTVMPSSCRWVSDTDLKHKAMYMLNGIVNASPSSQNCHATSQ